MRSVLALTFLLLQGGPAAPSGTIQGMVVQFGAGTPIPEARVSIGGAITQTDASGRFAFQNVPVGDYRFSFSHRDYIPMPSETRVGTRKDSRIQVDPGSSISDVLLQMAPLGAISGHVYTPGGNKVSGAAVQALRYAYQDGRRVLIPVSNASSDENGEYRLQRMTPDTYIVRVLPGNTADSSVLPSYFSGTINASAASALEVRSGIDLNGVDLTLNDSHASRIRGQVVVGITGQPAAGASVTLVPQRGNVSTGSSMRGTVSPDGTFEFRNVVPGSYDLVSTVSNDIARLAASEPIVIASTDIDDVQLILQPRLSVTGRVTIDDLPVGTPQPGLNGIRVELRREPFTPELIVLLPTIAPDGTFSLGDITPGDYTLKITTDRIRGYVKSAFFGGINALNPPFRINGPGDLNIAISLKSGSLAALVHDDSQKLIAGATVALIPDPPYRQRLDLYESTGSDTSGRARFEGLAPGDYRIFSWNNVPSDSWLDGDFIRQYEDRGKLVHIDEGSTETVEVRLIRRD